MNRPVPSLFSDGTLLACHMDVYGICMCCGVVGNNHNKPVDSRKKIPSGSYGYSYWGANHIGVTIKPFTAFDDTEAQQVHIDLRMGASEADKFLILDKDMGAAMLLSWVDEDTCLRLFGPLEEAEPGPVKPTLRDSLGRFAAAQAAQEVL